MNAALITIPLLAMLSGGATGPGRVYLQEGWYQLEEGFGESPDGEIEIAGMTQEDIQGLVEPQATPAPPVSAPDLREEIARFNALDCDEVRGRYVERILELHGVTTFVLDPKALAAWTRQRPSSPYQWPFFNGASAEPALAPLWGEPPFPPGPLSFDLTLQELARDLLNCPTPPPAP